MSFIALVESPERACPSHRWNNDSAMATQTKNFGAFFMIFLLSSPMLQHGIAILEFIVCRPPYITFEVKKKTRL
jgi:hypothetical protein